MIPTAEQLDALFRSGKMKRLGMGVRRSCYAIPDTDLCVKCYRSDAEIAEGRFPGHKPMMPLATAAVREIKKCRFNERCNTCCREYRYWRTLKKRLPSDLMSVFPTIVGCVAVPSRGWCIIEDILLNDDGSSVMSFHEALASAAPDERNCLLEAFDGLVDKLIRYAVQFYDPQNILVSKGKDRSFRLRIADFEPTVRTFVSIDQLFPFFVRRKIERRIVRYRKQFGIRSADNRFSAGK